MLQRVVLLAIGLALVGGLVLWLNRSPAAAPPPDPGRPPGIDESLGALLARADVNGPIDDDLHDALWAEADAGTTLIDALAYAPTSGPWQGGMQFALYTMGPGMLEPIVRAFLDHEGGIAKRFYVTAMNIVPQPEVWLDPENDPWARGWTMEQRGSLASLETPLIRRARLGSGELSLQALVLLTVLPPESRTEASVPLLIDALMQDNPLLLQHAACALTVSAPDTGKALPRLLRLLDGSDADAGEMAFSILRQLGKHEAQVAAAFLERAGKETATQAWGTWISAVADMDTHARQAIPLLRGVLEGASPERHARAAEALARMGVHADDEMAALLRAEPPVPGRALLLVRLAKTRSAPGPATRAALEALKRTGVEAAGPALEGTPPRVAPQDLGQPR